VARGRPGQGPRLVRVKRKGYLKYVWHLVWHEAGHTRARSTGTDDRGEAEFFLGRWLSDRGPYLDGGTDFRYREWQKC